MNVSNLDQIGRRFMLYSWEVSQVDDQPRYWAYSPNWATSPSQIRLLFWEKGQFADGI